MGAMHFCVVKFGSDPDAAFHAARDAALYEYGHSGYSGTIAEKDSYASAGTAGTPEELTRLVRDKGDTDFDDKWGPARMIEAVGSLRESMLTNSGRKGTKVFVFFGWASS